MSEKIKKRVREKVRYLLSEGLYDDENSDDEGEEDEEHPQKVDKRSGVEIEGEDDKMILFDGFIKGLVDTLSAYNTDNLERDKLSDAIQSQCLRRMFQADSEKEYYNYKKRLKGSKKIADRVMNHIQNNEEEPEEEPKFVDYENVGYDSIHKKAHTSSYDELMELAYEYNRLNERGDEEAINEFFWDKPDRLQEKIKDIAENVPREDLKEYGNPEDSVNKEEVLSEFREKIRKKVREYFEGQVQESESGDILEEFE